MVLSVETAIECHMRVHDVFRAVSLNGTTASSSSTAAGPPWSRSSCCPCQRLPSFQWRTVRVRKRPLGIEENEAVVLGLVSWVSDVCGCAVWKNPGVLPIFDRAFVGSHTDSWGFGSAQAGPQCLPERPAMFLHHLWVEKKLLRLLFRTWARHQ